MATTTARDTYNANQMRLVTLRARMSELWAFADAGQPVDDVELVKVEAQVRILEAAGHRQQLAAIAEQGAENEASWAAVETDRLARYRALLADLLVDIPAADQLLAQVALKADRITRLLNEHAADQLRPAHLASSRRQEMLRVAGQPMNDYDAGSVILALAGTALGHTDARSWGQFTEQFGRIRKDLQLPAT